MASRLTAKDGLIEKIEAAWSEMAHLLAELDDGNLDRVDPKTGWAIKDQLHHLATWESGVAALLSHRPRHEGMGLSRDEWQTLKLSQINQLVFARNRNRPAAEARLALTRSHEALLNALSGLSNDDLKRPYGDFEFVEGSRASQPVIGSVRGNTYSHYQEHMHNIRKLVGKEST